MNEQVEFVTMSDRETYLFDLQGFLVVEDILTAEEVKSLNESVDANLDKLKDDLPSDTAPELEGTHLRGNLGGVMTWEQPWCQPFRNLLAHRKLIPYLNTLLGRGWKLDHDIGMTISTAGAEGLRLHGSGNLNFNGSRFYAYQNGRMRCGLIVVQFYLTDVNPGDGGLCVIPGSHKANFPCPGDILQWEADREVVYQPTVRAGGIIIFNEATTHGTLPWRGKGERRTLFHRYTPKYLHYHHSYFETSLPDWVSEMSEAQQAVLEPPYMYHRPMIEDNGVTIVRPRREGE